jgi:hypothetical protein
VSDFSEAAFLVFQGVLAIASQVERRLPVEDDVEGLRHRLKPVAADPEAHVARADVPDCQPHHLRVDIDTQAPARPAFRQSFDNDHVKSHLRVTFWSSHDQK